MADDQAAAVTVDRLEALTSQVDITRLGDVARRVRCGACGHVKAEAREAIPVPTRSLGPCPQCGQDVTGFEGEPADPMPEHGYMTYLSMWTRYEPCGCTIKTAIEREGR